MRLYLRLGVRTYEVKPPGGRMGSAPGLAVSIQLPNVLPEHAELMYDGTAWRITQLGSETVFLNSIPLRMENERLGHTGTIQVGDTLLEFWRQDAEPPTLKGDIAIAQSTAPPRTDRAVKLPRGLELLTLKQADAVRPESIPSQPKAAILGRLDPNKTIDSPVGLPPGETATDRRNILLDPGFSSEATTLATPMRPVAGAPLLDPNKTITSPVGRPEVTIPILPTIQQPLKQPESATFVLAPPSLATRSPPIDSSLQRPDPTPKISKPIPQNQPEEASRQTPATQIKRNAPQPVSAAALPKQRFDLPLQLGLLLVALALVSLFAFAIGSKFASPLQLPAAEPRSMR